jgi:hypothetical protein
MDTIHSFIHLVYSHSTRNWWEEDETIVRHVVSAMLQCGKNDRCPELGKASSKGREL